MSDQITLEELKVLCKNMFIQKAAVAKVKQVKTNEEKLLKEMQDKILFHLESHELRTFDTGFGKVTRKNMPYAKITDKGALTAYLKERGIFEDMITYNATKMNSFFNEEMEKAKEEMNLDFKVDGMDVSSNRITLSVTSVKL
ncbi:MAG: hypothetical protein KAQ85_06105 [Thermodesulfovibrionia bacterium]|nr:hypothetical protein [Thermodesulfovibrionia bacterium]